MDIEIKQLFSTDTGNTALEEYRPADPRDFGVLVSVDIGTRGEPGADQFTIMVCTPSWLNNYLATRDEKHVFGRHYLIMQAWDYERLREVIHWRVQHTPGETWEEFASRLDLYLHWEFGQP